MAELIIWDMNEARKEFKSISIKKIENPSDNLDAIAIKADTIIGNPLIVIDGVITTKEDLKQVNPNTIKEITVLKGEAAAHLYGEKGKNGVIEIILKKQKNPIKYLPTHFTKTQLGTKIKKVIMTKHSPRLKNLHSS